MRKRFALSILGLIVSAFPTFIFAVGIYLILDLLVRSNGAIYWRMYGGRIEIGSLTINEGLYLPVSVVCVTGFFFCIFIVSLIMVIYEWHAKRKAKRAKEEERRKSYST